ncbi:hypothetical protein N5079_18800 [Planotetraspora sp. A-T 1434]|uniref:hypothetical protein n=1 Tax=Planotetraspora sp. A-T 1434 TaxID=2979219 RepID=UPI0021C1BD1C|nr:hypothetical protein [Planotetraspora sp. A-T 1434]MCT9932253.1 hypothetical protein [Planotetraspora sp. A-T 1434]
MVDECRGDGLGAGVGVDAKAAQGPVKDIASALQGVCPSMVLKPAYEEITMNRSLRAMFGLTAAAATIALAVPAMGGAASASPSPSDINNSSHAHDVAQERSFLFSYTFNDHLKVAGGNFTVDHRVFLVVKFNNGVTKFSRWVVARTHPVTPGGAIYVETTVAAPCYGGSNGYAQAYDEATRTWSPTLPVRICQRID